jgi:nucleotide-binding universal stress UspA family protein
MARPVNSAHRETGTEVSLSRDLKLFDITMIGVGGMIGAGIFALTGIAAGAAGVGLILAFFVGQLGAMVARDHGGEVLAVRVARVPPQLTLADGRYFLREGRQYLETLIAEARRREVPVHTVIRLGRSVPEALRKTAVENASDLIVVGWPCYTNTAGRLFGSVIDPLIDNPPTDIALVRYRQRRPVGSILVPVSAGPNSRRAVKLAISMARQAEDGPARVHVMTVIPLQSPPNLRVRAQQAIDYSLDSTQTYGEYVTTKLVEGQDIVETVVQGRPEPRSCGNWRHGGAGVSQPIDRQYPHPGCERCSGQRDNRKAAQRADPFDVAPDCASADDRGNGGITARCRRKRGRVWVGALRVPADRKLPVVRSTAMTGT